MLALIGYGVFLAVNSPAAAGGADSSGYLNRARLFAAGRLTTPLRTVPEWGRLPAEHLRPLGFMTGPDGRTLAPTYPMGLPLHLAVAGLIAGRELGPVLVGVGGALAALVLLYLVARELGLSPALAAAGAAVFGLFPVTIFIAIQPLSDVLAATWCLAAVWAALRARRAGGWAVACGAAFAVAVLVRPTNALLLPALVVLLGNWRRLLGATLGGLPGAIGLGTYNHLLYGGALRTGYEGAVTLQAVWVAPTLVHFAKWLAVLLPGVLLLLPVAALREGRARWRELVPLVLWFAPFVGFYAGYDVSHESWWCLRFLLPAVPALILGGLLGVAALGETGVGRRWRHAVTIAAAALVLWAAAASVYWTRHLNVFLTKGYEQAYAESCLWARDHLPPNAVIACMAASGAVFYYTDRPVLRWDQLKAEEFAEYAQAVVRSGRPVYALLFPVERDEALQQRMPGRWEKLAEIRGAGIWKWSAGP